MRYFLLFSFLICVNSAYNQSSISGTVRDENGEVLPFANVFIVGTNLGASCDDLGKFQFKVETPGAYTLAASFIGYSTQERSLEVRKGQDLKLNFKLSSKLGLDEVVITGTMSEVSISDSPVPITVYSPSFFKKNPSPSVFESMQNVNGVRPQLNCSVCNTGDIHINGLEGPYTMVLIDGMPIVSGLSTVYGLTGIPSSLIERVEVVRGPASSLYGSEAIGGLINIITKKPENHPILTAEIYSTTLLETNVDIGFKAKLNKHTQVLTGLNVFNYNTPIDNNGDNFTDISLSKRASIFQKWSFQRKFDRVFSIGARYYKEERWGGEMNFSKENQGGDEIYGESIGTDRYEFISEYQLPLKERLVLSTSVNGHYQESFYGTTPFTAIQNIRFAQLIWTKQVGIQSLLIGAAIRQTEYDDNTVATEETNGNGLTTNRPDNTILPGIFIQDNFALSDNHLLLLGMRYDRHSVHGDIWTPRAAYKWTINSKNTVRINVGTGFRVVNIFTEDHAALTGAREVIIVEELEPERSYNLNLNYIRKIFIRNGSYVALDAIAWYSRFTNRIVADYDIDPNAIVFQNLNGYGVTQGVSLNIDATLNESWKFLLGVTYMEVFNMEVNGDETVRAIPVLTENWSGTWSISYSIPKSHFTIDYTGNLYGPMKLPILSDLDPRPAESPWWSIQNIQITYSTYNSKWEFFGGVKNLLNFTPPSNSIARANDPFDKEVIFDNDGNAISSPNNPYALTFDPSYVYAPNQGIRAFLGARLRIW